MFAYRGSGRLRRLIDLLVRGLGRITWRVRSRPASMRCRFSIPGRACLRRRSSTAGALRRRSASSAKLRRRVPGTKVIGFPRGAGKLAGCATSRGAGGRGRARLDDRSRRLRASASRAACRFRAMSIRLRCWSGGAALDRAVDAVLEAFGAGPLIFNLGHGILPQTPIAHVERMLARVRGARGWHEQRGENARAPGRDRACDHGRAGGGPGAVAALRPLPLAQGRARHRGDRLDGRHALPAAAVRLSLRGRAGIATVRDLQGDGAPAAHGSSSIPPW